MSTVVRTEQVDRYVEWAVQVPTPIGELSKAWGAATSEAERLGVDTSWDDWAEVLTDDTHIIIRIRDRREVPSPALHFERLRELDETIDRLSQPSIATDSTQRAIHEGWLRGMREARDFIRGGRLPS